MIVIKILSGPHAGKEREVNNNMYEGAEIDPVQLLHQLVNIGSVWKIDFSRANPAEIIDWGRADMVARIMRALVHGRVVEFMGVQYRAQSRDEIPRLAGEIEDAIVYSGHHVVVARDDENGVLIEIGQREHPLQ
ncbi:hypothetical protein HYW59_00080 [Candidatus Kaiserbacteria bacterium]|nr:hypothetical protein [Candidatus Kaiserbacteria bacterium]